MAVEAPHFDSNFRLADFMLIGTDGKTYTAKKCWGPKGLLVMFICNHCPYVLGVIDRLVEDCKVLQKTGIGCVAIMPNDTVAYPADSFDNMKLFAKEHRFTFPYLIDELQTTARAYGAVCTPDIFGFNSRGQLRYRGRVDSAGKERPTAMTRRELRDSMLTIAETGEGPAVQHSCMGCSIKWK